MTRQADIRIVEVGARDGLQNEPGTFPVAHRIALIDALSESGLSTIEAGSFVSSRSVPQMANTDAVLQGIKRAAGVRYPVLVPNVIGMDRAIAAGVDEVAVFLSATESFSQRNINCSIAQSLDRAAKVISLAQEHGTRVRGYVSCTLGCPYEGDVSIAAVVNVADRLSGMGCFEISLGDTIGIGTPQQARAMVRAVAGSVPRHKLAVHFHDTFGRALENVLACLEDGTSAVDSSVGGLGGCPYAPGASGNLATEDLVRTLDRLGVKTGVKIDRLMNAVEIVENMFGIERRSKPDIQYRTKR